MGFLDHSTNNIIIDAVLTDTGRRKLADNDGSFKIAYFAFADDEVDYSIIEQYGRTVGKEKIAKNTPVFEAQTAGDIALKYRLLTLPDATIVRLPSISLQGTIGLSGNTISFNRTSNTVRTVTIQQTIDGETRIPDGTSDNTFTIFVPDRFLRVQGKVLIGTEPVTRISRYSVQRTGTNSYNGAVVNNLNLQVAEGLDDTAFTIYGDGTTIRAVVAIVGDQSGLRSDFQITITK